VNDQTPAEETPSTDHLIEGDAEPIPPHLRQAVADLARRAEQEADSDDDVVREYEERYYGSVRSRLAAPGTESVEGVRPPANAQHTPRIGPVSENERKWAALAHASTLLTALVALASGGLGVLLTMLIPLFIYFSFRKRSEYVAFHALQAFAIQLVGTVGWLALVVVGTIIGVALLFVSLILMIVLVGFALLPIVILAYIVFILVSLALPLGMVVYAVIAAIETWNGHNYRYPYIARWVEHQMYGDPVAWA
jgi:uncharacterized Tic20 family protein